MSNEWYKTDDLQWCKPLGERRYEFIQVLWIDTCPNDPENDHVVCSGLIDLNDYSDDEIESAVSSYYESYDDMLEKYNTTRENAHELDSIVAECIFEEECYTDCHSHGSFGKDKAVEYVEKWIEENQTMKRRFRKD